MLSQKDFLDSYLIALQYRYRCFNYYILGARLTAIFPLESLSDFMSLESEFVGPLISIQNLLQPAPRLCSH